jgi:O-antigen/teichoic acid export membrane protein
MPSLSISYILIIAIAIWGIGQVLENGLRGMGYSRPGTIANIGGLLVLIVGALFLVPLHRAAGMAASVFLAQATTLALLLFSFRRILAPKKIYAGLGSD